MSSVEEPLGSRTPRTNRVEATVTGVELRDNLNANLDPKAIHALAGAYGVQRIAPVLTYQGLRVVALAFVRINAAPNPCKLVSAPEMASLAPELALPIQTDPVLSIVIRDPIVFTKWSNSDSC